MRLFRRWSVISLLSVLSALPCSRLHAQETLLIATWGGAYEQAQQQALFAPFTQQTGIKIKTLAYNGGIAVLQAEPLPDLVDMPEEDAHRACAQGLLVRADFSRLLIKEPDTRLRTDFLPDAIQPCGVAHLTFSTLLAYDSRAFPGEKPQRSADFFDTRRFPGKRGLRREPTDVLEWALLADGVPLSQVYDLLSTERGMRLALRRLESIREHIVWWDEADEPASLLQSGQVTMTSGYNGRFFLARSTENPLNIIWDGQIIDRDVWVVPAQNQLSSEIRQFIRFATSAASLARLAEHIPYGPTRHSAMARIGNHPQRGIPMRDHLPTAPRYLEGALFRDTRWYAKTAAWRERVFREWLDGED
ncbi:MAG: ABC transporter substrate-binding protein [Thiolinea sp.]